MAKKPRKPASGDVATNRRAGHKFEVLEKFECGIELVGSEVKALREGRAQIRGAGDMCHCLATVGLFGLGAG